MIARWGQGRALGFELWPRNVSATKRYKNIITLHILKILSFLRITFPIFPPLPSAYSLFFFQVISLSTCIALSLSHSFSFLPSSHRFPLRSSSLASSIPSSSPVTGIESWISPQRSAKSHCTSLASITKWERDELNQGRMMQAGLARSDCGKPKNPPLLPNPRWHGSGLRSAVVVMGLYIR
jgi:hypothetical protein